MQKNDQPNEQKYPRSKSAFVTVAALSAGNFWWTTGRHWSTLPDIIEPSYWGPGARRISAFAVHFHGVYFVHYIH